MPWPTEVPVKRYPSDLTDEEWQLLEPVFEEVEPYTTGRPRTTALRERVKAIFYLNNTGCQWRYLPKDFPAYQWVSYYYHQWVDHPTWEEINTAIHRCLRQEVGRNEDPSAGIRDTPTVKGTPESATESGFDGGQWMKGRKRPIIVDTMGYPIVSRVHAANIEEGHGAREVISALFSMVDTVQKIGADGT